MLAAYDYWLPFRRQDRGPEGGAVAGRVRREVILPLEELLARAAAAGPGIPADLLASLESVTGVVGESLAAADSAGTVANLDQAWQGWDLKLQAFARDGGEVRMQRLGRMPVLGGEVARQLFLAVREAIGNSMRHAAARRIELMLVPWQEGCAVTVADNGRGMPGGRAGGGIGLASMRRRMARCGGELLVHPAEGTVVEFRAPHAEFGCWHWLREGGRLGRGVAAGHAAGLIRRWEGRVDACGGFERIFREWPQGAEAFLPDPAHPVPGDFTRIPEWIGRRLAAMGPAARQDCSGDGDRLCCRIEEDDAIDPLHWLDLALELSVVWPVMLRSESDDNLQIHVTRDPRLLPSSRSGASYASRVHAAWSGGISDLRADLSSYLHDVLAQELVAESMRWEIGREACPPSDLRSRFDQCQHELRRIAMVARSLSHELDDS